jgi:hypothetical protein
MARTNLTKRTVRDPEELRTKLAEHDTALDALDTTGTLPADSVSNTELRNSGALSVIGRSANSTGDPADISASAASGAVLRESGSTLGFGTLTNAALAAGILSADATGRALMATGLFDAATVLDKFAADSITNAVLLDAVQDGAFVADASTRALFAASFVNAGLIEAGAVTTAKLGTEVRGAHQSLSGPGAVNLTTPVTRCTSTGADDALTLADGSVNGQRKTIIHVVDGGSVKLTADGSLHLGDSLASITLANARDWITLEWQTSAWMLIGWSGAGVTFA